MFDWRNNLQLEVIEKRTHDTKTFVHPTKVNTFVTIANSAILHADTGAGLKDIETELPNFNFPEGKVLTKKSKRHFIMDLPVWGNAVVEENGTVVRVYDAQGKSIFKYTDPCYCPEGEKPYYIYTDSTKIREEVHRNKFSDLKNEIEVYNPNRKDATFEVVTRKLYLVLATMNTASISVYDATDVTATNGGDADLRSGSPTTNRSTPVEFAVGNHTAGSNLIMNGVIQWTLPSGTGEISKISMFLYNEGQAGDIGTINCHKCTRTFVENQVTWNSYSTGNAWTTGGGDYEAAVIDTASNAGGLHEFIIRGTGSDNPLTTLTWGDAVGFVLRDPSPSGNNYNDYHSKESLTPSKKPYLEITYTPSGPTNLKSYNTNLKANIKSINTNLIANVKSINTNT